MSSTYTFKMQGMFEDTWRMTEEELRSTNCPVFHPGWHAWPKSKQKNALIKWANKNYYLDYRGQDVSFVSVVSERVIGASKE